MTDATLDHSLLANIYRGAVRWDIVHPFPEQEDGDRRAGDRAVAELARFLERQVDPTEIDRRGRLPDGLLDDLRARGYLKLRVGPELGGLDLSGFNTFRLVEAAASWSTPLAYLMAIHNGLGASAYLPLLPAGPLRDLVCRRVAEGAISSDADTEPAGAANWARRTTATPGTDGAEYVISGEKICIGNAPIADLFSVSATVRDSGKDRVRVFFVDAGTPGLRIRSVQEFMGLKGFPMAALTLREVRVPRDRMLIAADDDVRLSAPLSSLWARARLNVISAPALAIARLCLHWSREFCLRRTVDGRGLGRYDEIQRSLASSLAEVFAIESVVMWCLLAPSGPDGTDLRFEHMAAKNITSVTCWRIVDRTMSLLAAEGFETAASKARRGAQPLPLERFFRDARSLRIAGGVDFLLDSRAAPRIFATYDPGWAAGELEGASLSDRNLAHVRCVGTHTRRFAGARRALAKRHPDAGELFARERVMVLLSQIANELFTMAVVLARASTVDARDVQGLADVYCTAARHRLAGWWRELADDRGPAYAVASERWLERCHPSFLLRDVITAAAPVERG